ncbi:MAG: aminocarboxymuconate-semialdehyde decarboxylase [Chloroflexi bacterium]|nr:aminocarboxymuconate-semialdehyde decarboxylase [Chloroflexota bacterium]
MPTIDVQVHTVPRTVWAEMLKVSNGSSVGALRARHLCEMPIFGKDPQMLGALDDRIPIMDDAGVDMEVLCTGMNNASLFEDRAQNVDMARATNDAFSGANLSYPQRYRFFATPPLPHVQESVDEIRRASKLPGFAGVMMPADFGMPMDDERLDDLYAEINRLRGLLFLHPNGADNPGRYGRWGLETMIGWPALNALAIMEMILGGVLDRFPDITLITPHLSGTMLFLAGRIDRYFNDMRGPAFFKCQEQPIWYMKRMYHDSVSFQHSALELARTMVGSDHILAASDYPWQCRKRYADFLDVVDTLDWADEERAGVRGGNMERLLRERGCW